MSRTVVEYELTYGGSPKCLKLEHTLEGTLEKPTKHDDKVLKKIIAIVHDEIKNETGCTLMMTARTDGKLVFCQEFDKSSVS